MANLPAVAADGVSVVYLKSFGTGTDLDPFVPGQALIDGDGNFLTSLLVGTERALTVALVDDEGNQILNLGGDATAANQVTANNSLASIDAKLPASLGVKTAANSLSVAPASDAVFATSLPVTSSATILSLTTAATGTNYTAFSSQACTSLDIVNNTGTTLEYRRNGAGTALQIPDRSARLVIGITNANQVGVRRTDTSNTQVTLQAEAFA